MNRNYYLIGLGLILLVLAMTAIAYPRLPASVPTHWDARGNINGWSDKSKLFIVEPAIMSGILVLFWSLPWLSPKRFEVDSFRTTYLFIMLLILATLGYVHALILASGLSWHIDIARAVEGGVCVLISLLGNVLGKVRRNFYVGIRTPWTIANEHVWNATHRFAAKTFFAAGVIGMIAVISRAPFWIPVAVILAAALIPAIYSLAFYKQLERRGQLS